MLTTKVNFSSVFINIGINGDLASYEKLQTELFNENYIDIVEKSWGKKSSSVGNWDVSSTDESNVKEIISAYISSILRIKNKKSFGLPQTIVITIVLWQCSNQ